VFAVQYSGIQIILNTYQRQGFFRHPIFTEIFGAQWLRKRGEATGEYAAAFNPVPLPTLALIATAVGTYSSSIIIALTEFLRSSVH
jgi:hypothetical protein